MYACIFVCMHVCMCIYDFMYVCIPVCIYININCMLVFIYANNVRWEGCIQVDMYMNVHT